jgi:hypothetical protein
MATLKIYEGRDSILTYQGECTTNLTAHKTGMNFVVNTQEKLILVMLELIDIKRLAFESIDLIQQHGELRDKLVP